MANDAQSEVIDALSELLANSYTLYLKTHNYHWNVTGPQFNALHLMFEDQYTELAAAVDEIAERIRALGVRAPGSYSEFAKLTCIDEGTGKESAKEMIEQLVLGQESVARTARDSFGAAEEASDQSSADLFTQRMKVHEKNAWMLRSLRD